MQVYLVVARERRLLCRRIESHSRIKVDLTGTPTYGVQVSLVVARERRLLCRRMESHSRIKGRLDGNAHIWGASVSSRCARAALTVQAHGTPLAHKSRLDGNAHIWGASVSSRCALIRRHPQYTSLRKRIQKSHNFSGLKESISPCYARHWPQIIRSSSRKQERLLRLS